MWMHISVYTRYMHTMYGNFFGRAQFHFLIALFFFCDVFNSRQAVQSYYLFSSDWLKQNNMHIWTLHVFSTLFPGRDAHIAHPRIILKGDQQDRNGKRFFFRIEKQVKNPSFHFVWTSSHVLLPLALFCARQEQDTLCCCDAIYYNGMCVMCVVCPTCLKIE